jgi:hypothetical protein
MGRNLAQKIEIKDDQGLIHSDPATLADMFVSFFINKIEALDMICPIQSEDICFDRVEHKIFFTEQ